MTNRDVSQSAFRLSAPPPDERSGLLGRLLTLIAYHRLGPGDRLPGERDLAERFGVGRGAVREALVVLETLRVIERRPNSGIYLRAVEKQGSIEAIVLQAELGIPLTGAEVREVVELRRILEMQAMRLAAERRHEDDIRRLDAILAQGAATVSAGKNLADDDAAFHLAMVEATGNHVFLRVVHAFYLMSRNRRRAYFADGRRAPLSQAQHVAMRDAVAAGDPDRAEAAMGGHLRGVESYWLELLERRAQDE
nr:FadR/GntR family transcriptional regulator [Pseudoroseomonas vastitatis]